MKLTLDGEEHLGITLDRLRELLSALADRQWVDAWLTQEDDGPVLCMLKSDDRAFLLWMREPGDPGFSSRGRAHRNAPPQRFRLSNGQVDAYPAAWTIPFDEARRAMEHFCVDGTRAPFVKWHDDG